MVTTDTVPEDGQVVVIENVLGVIIMVHEVGHMFNASHTFNGDGNNCNTGNHSLNFAYEIGSGSTIMSYEGNCQTSNNYSNDGDDYFHSKSLESIYNFILSSGGCSTNSSTGKYTSGSRCERFAPDYTFLNYTV